MLLLSPLTFALNQALQADPDSLAAMTAFTGRSVRIELTDWQKAVCIEFETNNLIVNDGQDAVADLMIAAPLSALIDVARHPDNLFSSHIQILGDVQFAKQLQDWLDNFEFDWESQIARLTGDTLAGPLTKQLRQTAGWLKQSMNSIELSTAEYLREEARLLPDAVEVAHFMQQVDNLHADMERLEARIRRLGLTTGKSA
ncbi:Protein YigP [Methylophaga frappieri]|uniref:Ubiquinone biosynthesis accessory factor UbiJ n=1 Tax=Methylophaga frappieri (strain ATCC BAA-2434 / DSM 25690 / JAM7) TaxID=754477 RepID=I1YKR5_METFJ|nr:SCP2 sterol-binding domain-containing protein [Methylophaga frappieri]AFJ03508.1 Protein YigP [Methylophaga frappieri]